MTAQFRRAASLIVAGVDVTGLAVSFRITQTLQVEPNTADITVRNLAPDTRKRLQQSGAPVDLSVGYTEGNAAGTLDLLFTGTARFVSHTREGTDRVTRLQCGDGEKASKVVVRESWGKGKKKKDVAAELLKQSKLEVAKAIKKVREGMDAAMEEFVRGFSVDGPVMAELDKVLGSMGHLVSVQNGVVEVLAPGECTDDPPIILSPTSGLVGSPEVGEDGVVKFKALLQAGLHPGRRVTLDTEAFQGDYRVEKATHVGNTHGPEWTSECEAKRLK